MLLGDSSNLIIIVKKGETPVTYNEVDPEQHALIYEKLQDYELQGIAPWTGFNCRNPGSDELSDDEITGIVSVRANK